MNLEELVRKAMAECKDTQDASVKEIVFSYSPFLTLEVLSIRRGKGEDSNRLFINLGECGV